MANSGLILTRSYPLLEGKFSILTPTRNYIDLIHIKPAGSCSSSTPSRCFKLRVAKLITSTNISL